MLKELFLFSYFYSCIDNAINLLNIYSSLSGQSLDKILQDFGIEPDISKFQADLERKKLLKKQRVGSGFVSGIKCKDALNFGIKKILLNTSYFLKREPSFRRNTYPLK